MSILLIEVFIFCALFTIMILILSKDPIKSLYNYPPKIQERVKSLEQYKDKIPTNKNKFAAKIIASVVFVIILAIVMRYVNGYDNYKEAFFYSFILWTAVNFYDAIVMDCIWFCHDKRFVLEGTEDMVKEYHDYWFHIKGSLIGELLGIIVCSLAAMIVAII